MNTPFLDGSEGQWMVKPEDMKVVMKYYWKADFQIHIHTNGDKAMDLVIQNVINLQKDYPRQDHRTTIEHAGYFTPEQADQLAELGKKRQITKALSIRMSFYEHNTSHESP